MTTQSDPDYNAALADARKATQVHIARIAELEEIVNAQRTILENTNNALIALSKRCIALLDERDALARQLAAHEQPTPRPIDTVAISRMIVQLHDQHGLSFDQISARLHHDFGITISRAAVWQRYKRETREGER